MLGEVSWKKGEPLLGKDLLGLVPPPACGGDINRFPSAGWPVGANGSALDCKALRRVSILLGYDGIAAVGGRKNFRLGRRLACEALRRVNSGA